MKKTIFTLAAVCMAVAANATILRVSNVDGSSAPYKTFTEAQDAAAEGDTIMMDSSYGSYGEIQINKKLVVLGPGYWLMENGIIKEGASNALFEKVTVSAEAEGTVLKGLVINKAYINANNAIINRCCFLKANGVNLGRVSGVIIHQNFICYGIFGETDYHSHYIQVTNNIMNGSCFKLVNSYIANNLLSGGNAWWYLQGCTVEHNIINSNWTESSLSYMYDCSLSDNYVNADIYHPLFNVSGYYDGMFAAAEIDPSVLNTYGPFAGDDPYVLSGVPSGPIIKDITMPSTIEKGKKMNVTIKVGIQK